MSVYNVLNAAIYSKLTGGTALTAILSGGTASIYGKQATDGAALPYVVFSPVAGGPLNICPADMRDMVYFVRGYSLSDAGAGSIDAQISSLLHGGSLSVSGYTNYNIVREQDFSMIENLPSGQKVYMAGANYRISLS